MTIGEMGMEELQTRDMADTKARYLTPINVFRTRQAGVPIHAFARERDDAFAPDRSTGFVTLDLSAHYGFAYPATTPAMLGRYAVVRAGETLACPAATTGLAGYVLRGEGVAKFASGSLDWAAGDAMLLPPGALIEAAADAILFCLSDEPLFSFLGAVPKAALPAIRYPAAEIERQLTAVYERGDDEDLTGRAVFLTHDGGGAYGTTTAALISTITTLEPGGVQRPHHHNATAITLCLSEDAIESVVDGVSCPWRHGLVQITPPTAVHAIYNRGTSRMTSFVSQDSGLFYYLRATGFDFDEA